MIKRPTLHFLPAKNLVNVQYGETSGDGTHGLFTGIVFDSRKGYPPCGLPQGGRFSDFLQGFRLQEMAIPLQATGV